MNNQHNIFVFKQFYKDTWEDEVKSYIAEVEVSNNKIWYKNHPLLEKMDKELIPLGYYIKYDESGFANRSFKLKKNDDEADAIISNSEVCATVQIVSAFYDSEEAKEDKALMQGEDISNAYWIENQLIEIKDRIINRIQNKNKKHYT